MNEERIIKEIQSLKDQLVTKEEFNGLDMKVSGLDKKVSGLDMKVSGLDMKVSELGIEVSGLRKEVKSLDGKVSGLQGEVGNLQIEVGNIRKDMIVGFKEVGDKIDDLNLSSKSFDNLREQNPIKRIERLEQHAGLPAFVPTISEEEE